jgi:hypothetical protein
MHGKLAYKFKSRTNENTSVHFVLQNTKCIENMYVGLFDEPGVIEVDNIVACRPVPRQRPRNKLLDNGRY